MRDEAVMAPDGGFEFIVGRTAQVIVKRAESRMARGLRGQQHRHRRPLEAAKSAANDEVAVVILLAIFERRIQADGGSGGATAGADPLQQVLRAGAVAHDGNAAGIGKGPLGGLARQEIEVGAGARDAAEMIGDLGGEGRLEGARHHDVAVACQKFEQHRVFLE